MSEPPKKEIYGDPIKIRLAAEFWRIVDDLMPRSLAGVEYITENHNIDDEWRGVIGQLGVLTLEWKYAILGFKSLLTKEDADAIGTFDELLAKAMSREGRQEVAHGQMEGRAELFAKRRLQLEDRALALYYQVLDMRAVAFKNKMWDVSGRPEPRGHAQ